MRGENLEDAEALGVEAQLVRWLSGSVLGCLWVKPSDLTGRWFFSEVKQRGASEPVYWLYRQRTKVGLERDSWLAFLVE
jgi:hypothetical protein